MSKEGLTLSPLHPEDIDEKIYLNQSMDKLTPENLELAIIEELKQFEWHRIRAEVQIQNYKEQLVHIRKRIEQLKGKENPYLFPDYIKRLQDMGLL